ncbi:GNAT family N-acetyltransferase [Mesobacillus maritimus]|uniref:GNAT family N-acetyltransferase n=1 Tax=Mesobacillus maritimus TaxID=1643336 RepID=UPI00203C6027|nr:GNAT family N-acetyltransferase [Mesobacillus maritimus]MCM3586000.1 GNAT family N-acetyltransferase [Mesobacillus maritimus]
MKIRKLCAEDAISYRNIRLEALQTNPEAFGSSYDDEKNRPLEMFAKRLSSEGTYTFGAFIEERLVGTITLIRETSQKTAHKANIFAMYVNPDERCTGVGRALLSSAIEHAKALVGIEQINLTVVSTNQSAKALYESMGFRVYGTEIRALKLANETYLDENYMVLFI